MKKISLLLTLSLSLTGYSQDWELFPLKQKMYFSEEWPPNVEIVDLYLMDSIRSFGQDSILYFNKNLDLIGAGDCYNESLEYLNWNPNIFFIDSLVQKVDTVFYYSTSSATPFYFLPKAIVGESWVVKSTNSQNDFDEIIITCSDNKLENFLGITDSVKTFTLASNTSTNQIPENKKIKLSKNYGLIEFVPFTQFLYHPNSAYFHSLKLIGINSLGAQYGFKQPGFEDYFHLSEGDVLFWHRLNDSDFPNNPDQSEYYKDSITQVLATADSIVYIYDRTKRDWDGNIFFYNALSDNFSKSNFQNIVETPPNWLGYGNNHLGFNFSQDLIQLWKSEYLSIKTDSITGDTTTIFSFWSDAFSIDTLSCDINEFIDLGYSFIVNTKYGVSKYCSYSFGSDCVTLTGSIIDGELTGSIDFPTATHEIPTISTLDIYPNPAANSIIISNLDYQIDLNYKIITSTGQLLKYGKLNDNKIQINELVSGLYLVVLFNKDDLYRGIFTKQ